jgi:hypothetical protein
VLSSTPAINANFSIAQNGCSTTIAANASCSMQLVFAPKSAGPLSGALTLMDNAPSGTQIVSLSGVGVDFSLSASGPTTQTLSSGGSASYPLLLSSLPSLSGNVAFACTGAPKNATCVVSPSTPALGSTTTLTVTVETGVQASLRAPSWPWMRVPEIFVALLLPVGLVRRRRWRFAAMLVVLVGVNGCGAGRAIPLDGGTGVSYPTPAGTYNITVTGTAAGVSRTVGLTLVVQ